MVPVSRSLERISTGHTIFEPDQVLTHEQLNSLAGYADDQARLTRVRLLGVGVICGLHVSLSGSKVTVNAGVGVTTDGDLLHLDQDTVFNRFKPYDESYPAYPPLYVDGDVTSEMLPVFELVAQGAREPTATPLSQLSDAAGAGPEEMAALFLMESWVRDDDLCSGTDCDNLGQEAVNTPRLLLLRRSDLGALREALATPGVAWFDLNEIVAERPTFSPSLDSPAELGAVYRAACTNTHKRLEEALPNLLSVMGDFLGDAVPSGGAAAWTGRLNEARGSFDNTHIGIQCYYDFLKDVVDTYNDLREALFGDTTTCAPPMEGFPKHLLLGNLVPDGDADANRTRFYPSPLTGRSAGQLDHARFLTRKLHALLEGFQPRMAANAPIRITPSAFEDRPLEERAIPSYYFPGGDDPLHRRWSYGLTRRGMEAFNYSYHAASYDARGGAANPLGSQIGRFAFFRIEGHLGKPVADAVDRIEEEIRAQNLPFAVRSVLMGTDRTRVVKRPGILFTDLHHVHHLLRRDLSRQLQDVQQFSGEFRMRVDTAIDGDVVDDSDDSEGISFRRVAQDSDTDVQSAVQAARAPLEASYTTYRETPSWQESVNTLLRTAGQFKSQLSSVVKTDFSTPFDTLIGSRQIDWLPWLDRILDAKEEEEEARLLFSRFVEEHPGVEHFGGVVRGGTFVLVYDDAGTVIADFMLWYHAPEEAREPVEPPLEEPGIRPPYIIDEGIKIIPQRAKFFGDLKRDVVDKINETFTFQAQYLDLFKDSYINVLKDSLTVFRSVDQTAQVAMAEQVADPALQSMMEGSRLEKERLDILTQEAAREDLTDEQRAFYEKQILTAEEDLARTTERITGYVSESGMEVKSGSDGFKAVMEVSGNMDRLTTDTVVESTKSTLNSVAGETQNQTLKIALNSMLNI